MNAKTTTAPRDGRLNGRKIATCEVWLKNLADQEDVKAPLADADLLRKPNTGNIGLQTNLLNVG